MGGLIIITDTILGVPYYNSYSIIYLDLMAPMFNLSFPEFPAIDASASAEIDATFDCQTEAIFSRHQFRSARGRLDKIGGAAN